DEQWQLIAPSLPKPRFGGRPRGVDLREVLNGVLDVVRGGVPWRMLPHDLPPWGTVHFYYRCWRLDGIWARILEVLRPACGTPTAAGRAPRPRSLIPRPSAPPAAERRGMTRASGPRDGSVRSSWTRWGYPWPWWCTRRPSRTATG